MHVVALFSVVVPETDNNVFMDILPVFKRTAFHVPDLVFKIMLFVDSEAMVKSPTLL